MSDDLAVAAVTASIESILRAAATATTINPAPTVDTGALDAAAADDTIRVHLLRVEPNTGVAAETVPLRSTSGELRAVPTAAVDLHYLLSFHSASSYTAQRLLAVSAVALLAEAEIGQARLAVAATETPQVAGNDLAAAHERVRLSYEWMSADELSRLWSMFPPGSHVPTLAVRAGPVVVNLDQVPPTPARVADPRSDVTATMPPVPAPAGAGDGSTPPGFAPFRLGAVSAASVAGAAAGLVSGTVTAKLVPAPPAATAVELRLDRRPADGMPAIRLGPVATTGSATVKPAFVDAPAGDYLVNLVVDGQPTLPEQDAAGLWVRKQVTL
jgi:hypothetical protein